MRDIDSRRLSPAKRIKILERDSNTCMYCLEVAEEVDHIIPWSYRHDDDESNLVASCWLCNHIASNKLFDTFKEKKDHIVKRKNNILKHTVIAIWMESELEDMGPGMKRDIRNNCLVFDEIPQALRAMKRIKDAGLEVRMGTIAV